MSNRTISYKGVQLSVGFTYYPPSKGARERGSGVQLEPDEPASVDIAELSISITFYCEGKLKTALLPIDELLEDQIDEIEAKLLEEDLDDDENH